MANVNKLVKLSKGEYNGRDKFAKCLQFGLQIIVELMIRSDPKDELAQRLGNCQKGLGLSRKGLRLFKSIEMYKKMTDALAKKLSPDELLLQLWAELGMFFRWGYDNMSFLEKTKAVEKADYGVTSNKFRAFASIAYIVMAVRGLLKAQYNLAFVQANAKQEEGGPSVKEQVAKCKTKHLEAVLELVGRVCGLMNGLHSAKLYMTSNLLQGIFGFVDAFISLRKTYLAIK